MTDRRTVTTVTFPERSARTVGFRGENTADVTGGLRGHRRCAAGLVRGRRAAVRAGAPEPERRRRLGAGVGVGRVRGGRVGAGMSPVPPTRSAGSCSAGAFFFALSEDASYYTVADYGLRHGDLPLGAVALLAQPGWAPGIVALGLLILLFPDGRLPSSRWRWLAAAYAAVAALWIAGADRAHGARPGRPPHPGGLRREPAAAQRPRPRRRLVERAPETCSSRCSSPAGWPRSPARRSASGARQGNAASS